MAGQTAQVTMKINADTSAAQKQMTDLMRTLQTIQKTNFDSAFNSLKFDKAAKSAEVLANNIAKATNADTGKLDLTALSANLRQSGTSAGELATNLLSAGAMGQQAFRQLSTAIASSEVPLKKMNTTLANMATTLKNTVKWELSSTAVHGLESALSGAVSYVKSLNSSLNDIRIVTGQSVEDMARFAQQANVAAKALSTTTKAYSDASLIYYQQGDSAEQAAKKAAITIKAANASFGTSAQEMSEYLTAVWNSYRVGADELERYVDIMAALGAKTATSLEEIATSMQKVAATANTVGVSMEQVSSIIATVSSVTRESAESIGTSYKTIFARMGDLKLGKTDDGVGLGQVSSQLKSIGVNVLDATGNLREMGDIITDLGNKWQTMSAAQKTATAQVVAGKRQYTQLMALFENWDMYNQNLDISINADGSLQEMADTYAESWEAASNRLKASFEGLYSKLLNDEALIKFTDGITSIVDAVSSLVDAFGGLQGILGNIGMIASKVFSQQIGNAAGKAAEKVSNAWSQKGVIAENLFHPIKRARGETQEYKSVEQQKYGRELEATKQSYQTAIEKNPITFKEGSAARAELDNSIAVIEAKQQLLAIEGRLGPAAAQAAQEAINSMQNELNMVQQLAQEYEDMQKEQKDRDKTGAGSLLIGTETTAEIVSSDDGNITNANDSQFVLNSRAQDAGFSSWTEATAAYRTNATQQNVVKRGAGAVSQLDITTFDRGQAGAQANRENAAAALRRSQMALQTTGLNSPEAQAVNDAYSTFIADLENDAVNDFTGDLNTLEQALQKLQEELKQTGDAIKDNLTMEGDSASSKIGEALEEITNEANDNGEKIYQQAEARARAKEAKDKIPTGQEKPKKKKMKDMTLEEKSDYIGKKAATAANAIASLTASLSSASNLVDTLNDDSATLGDKVGAVMGTVGNIATGFATGGIVGGVAAVAGAAIGAVTSIIQAQKEAELAKKKAAREAAADKVNESKAELQNQKNLMTNFTSLLNAKKEGQDVDEELKQAAIELADAYDVTGAAVANLTGNYENFIKTIQEAAGAAGEMEESAIAAYEAAVEAIEKNSNISNKDSVWINGKEQDYVDIAKKYGYGDDRTGGKDGKVWTRDLANKLGTELKDGYTVEDLLSEEELNLEGGESFRELFMDGANLLISANDSAEYKDMVYTRLKKAQEIMVQKGISKENRLYKDMQALIDEMQFEVETYRQAKENLNNVQINAMASQYMNLDTDNYAASQYFTDWKTNYEEIKQILQKQDPTLQGEELEKLAIATMQQVTGTNSALSGFDSAMAAALEIYNNNVEEAIDALDTIERTFGSLDYVNAEVIMAYQAGGDWQKAYQVNANREKGQMAITQAESIKNLKMTEDMTYDEMSSFYDTYTTLSEQVQETLQIGTMSFEDLMALSFEDRTNYLNNLSKMLEESAGDIIDDAIEEQKALVKSYEEILNDVNGIQIAKIGDKALTQQQWEEFLEKEAESLEEAQEFLTEYYTIGTDGKLKLREEYTSSQAATAKKKLDSEVQTVINNAMTHEFASNETMGDYLSNQVFNRSFLAGIGITNVTDKQIKDAMEKYQQLRAAYIEAHGTIDELTEMQLIWEAMGSAVDSVTSSIQKLTSAIKQLPTNTEELEKLAKLFNVDMNTLINSNSTQRARWVLGNSTAPAMDQFTTYVNGDSVLSVDEYNKVDYVERAGYQQTIDYGGYVSAQEAYTQQQEEAFTTLTSGQNYQNAVNGIQTLTNAYLNFISTGEIAVEVQSAMRMNGIDPSTIQSVEDYHKALIEMYATIQKNAKYAELLYEQTYGEYDRNRVWSASEMDSAEYKAWAQVSSLYTEADMMQQSMDSVEEQYINSRLTAEKAQVTKFKEELDKISSASDSGISLLNTYLSDMDNFSFSNIEKLRVALEDAGVAASVVESTLARLTDVDTSDSDKIRAAMEASLQLAMSKIGTVEAQAMQYRELTDKSEEPWADLPLEQIFEWYYKRDTGEEVSMDVPWAEYDSLPKALEWYYRYNSNKQTDTDKIPTAEEFKTICAGAVVEWSYSKAEHAAEDGKIDPTEEYALDKAASLGSAVVGWAYDFQPSADSEDTPPSPGEGETSVTLGSGVFNWSFAKGAGTDPKYTVKEWVADATTLQGDSAKQKYLWGMLLLDGAADNKGNISAESWNAEGAAIEDQSYDYGIYKDPNSDDDPPGTWVSPSDTAEYKYTFKCMSENDPLYLFMTNKGTNNAEGTEGNGETYPFVGYRIGEVGKDGNPIQNPEDSGYPTLSEETFDLTYSYEPETGTVDPTDALEAYPSTKAAELFYQYKSAGGTAPWEVFEKYVKFLYDDYIKSLNLADGVEPPSMDEWLDQEGINGSIINTILYSYDMAPGSDTLIPDQTTITIFYKYQEADGSDHPDLASDDVHNRADAINRYTSDIRETERMERGEYTHTQWQDYVHENYTQQELDDMLATIIPDPAARNAAITALMDDDEKFWQYNVINQDWFTPFTEAIIAQRQETEKQYAALLPEYTVTAADLERTGKYDEDEIAEILANQTVIQQRGELLTSSTGVQWNTMLAAQGDFADATDDYMNFTSSPVELMEAREALFEKISQLGFKTIEDWEKFKEIAAKYGWTPYHAFTSNDAMGTMVQEMTAAGIELEGRPNLTDDVVVDILYPGSRNNILRNEDADFLRARDTRMAEMNELYSLSEDYHNSWSEYETAVQDWLNGDGADIAAQMIEATAQYLSDDPDVSAIGYELIRGIGAGLEAAGINMEQFLEASGLAPEVVAAFKAVLEINSPSRLTMALGQYLIDGLVVGTSKAAASMDFASAVKGIDRKIFEALKAELDSGINKLATDDNAYFQGMQQAVQKLAPNFQLDEAQDGVNIDKYIDSQVEKYENGLDELENRAFASREEAEAALEGMGLTIGEDNGITITETPRALPNNSLFDGRPNPKAIQAVPIEGTVYKINISDEATEAAIENMETTLQDGVISTFTIDWVNNGYKSDPNLTPFERQLIEDGLADAKIELGMNSTDSFQSIEQVEEALDYLEDYYGMSLEDLMQQTENAWAQVADEWDKALEELLQLETEAAAKVYTLWMDTFQAIAAARKAIVSGENIIDAITDEAQGEALIYKWLREGKDASDIQRLLHGGATVDDTEWSTWDLDRHAASNREWSFIAQGESGYQRTSAQLYNQNVANWVYEDVAPELESIVGETMDEDWLANIITKSTTGTKAERAANKALLSYLESEGIITTNANGTYSYTEGHAGKVVDDHFYDTILKGLYGTYKVDSQEEVDEIVAGALWSQYQAQDKLINGMIDEQTAIRDTSKAELELVQKALRGETLTVDEQIQLDSILAEGETLAMAFARLAAATDGASEQIELLKEAKNQGYIQGEDGLWYREVSNGTKTERVGAYASFKEAQLAIMEKYGTTEGFQFTASTRNPVMMDGSGNTVEIPDNIIVTREVPAVQKELLGEDGQLTAENLGITEPIQGLVNTPDTILETYANMLNMTNEELREYIALIEGMDEGQDFDLTTAAGALHAAEVARITKEAGEGLDTLRTDWSKTFGILKGETKVSTKEMASTMSSFRKNMSKVFNVKPELFDDKFIEENLDNFDKLLNGTEEEAAEAGKAIEKALLDKTIAEVKDKKVEIDVDTDGTTDKIQTVQQIFDSFLAQNADAEVGATVNLDTSDAIAGFNALLSSGTMTAEGITAALNAIGWEPEIEYRPVTLAQAQAARSSVRVRDSSGNYVEISGDQTLNNETQYYLPVIKGATRTGSGAAAPSLNPSSGGGGGGGGGKPKQLEKKDPNDEKDRYHEINQRLERMSQLLDKVSKYKDRAFGKSYLKNLEQEIKLMKQQEGMYERKLNEAKEWLEYDKGRLAEFGVTFDEMGNINNYDEVIEAAVAEYNAFVERYNAMTADQQKESDENEEQKKAEEKLENLKEYIGDYEDSINNIYDLQNQILEAQNQQSALMLEKIQYKAEYQIEINEDDIELLEYFDSKWEEVLDKQDDRLAGMIEQGAELHDTLSLLATEQQELDAAYAAGEINLADYVEGLREVKDGIMENLEALQDLQETINELYGETLDMISEKVEEQTGHIDAATEAMGSYITILGLMGRGKNFRELEAFYAKQVEYSFENAKAQRQHLDLLLQEKEYYDAIIASGEELSDTQKIWYQDLLENIDEVNGELLSSTEEVLNNIASEYENVINGIFKELDEVMGGAAGSLAGLADQYSYYTETQERYVTSAKELYEVSKLNRDIENSIEDSTTTASKQMLAALKERINAQSELNELTEYDIEMNRLQYELALAKIGLEEAQNAKDTVRLTRDESGNYVYQYTANNDKINEAEQKYEDVLQQINELAYNRVTELEQMFLDAQQQYYDAAQEIANDTTLTTEERTIKLNELYSRFCETQQYIQEQYQNATGHLMTSNTVIAQHYNDTLTAQAMNSRENINETIAGMIEDNETYKESFREAIAQINEAQDEQKAKMDEVAAATKLDYVAMTAEVGNYDTAVQNAGDTLSKVLDGEGETAGMLEQIHTLGEAWDGFAKTLAETVIPKFETLLQNIVDTIRELANLEDTVNNADLTPPSTGGETSGAVSDTSGTTDDGSGGKEETKNEKPAKWIDGEYNIMSGGTKLGGPYGSQAKADAARKNIEDQKKAYYDQMVRTMGPYAGHAKADWEKWRDATIETVKSGYWTREYKTGGLADFTGPAWLDGTKTAPELVLNATDTQNMLSAIGTLRELDTDTIAMLVATLNAATASLFGALSGNYHATGVSNTNTQELNQNVEIHADFPNVTDRNEIVEAIDDLVNRAAQFAQKKMW